MKISDNILKEIKLDNSLSRRYIRQLNYVERNLTILFNRLQRGKLSTEEFLDYIGKYKTIADDLSVLNETFFKNVIKKGKNEGKNESSKNKELAKTAP